jgi:hypothetical protein
MPHNKRFRIPIADLISDFDTWTIKGADPDYMHASLRYLHMASLRLDLRSRPWLPRWAKLFEHAHQKIETRLPSLPDSKDEQQWQSVFLAMAKGEWTARYIDELILMLRRSSLSQSFQNRAILMFMAQSWCHSKVGHETRLYIQKLFAGLVIDPTTNPVYIARFLEQIVEFTAPQEFHDIIQTAYMNTQPITNHVHYTVWEILLRQQPNPNRTSQFLTPIPLAIRQNVALQTDTLGQNSTAPE